MADCDIRVDERYLSFKNIDCFQNAVLVIDSLIRVLQDPKNMNPYWEKILPTVPDSYHSKDPKLDVKEEVLYFVCSKVFYLEELFENAEDEIGINALRKCELECC